jgi:hypothetical protein
MSVKDGCLETQFPQAPKPASGKLRKAKARAKSARHLHVRIEDIESLSATATQKGIVDTRHHPKIVAQGYSKCADSPRTLETTTSWAG